MQLSSFDQIFKMHSKVADMIGLFRVQLSLHGSMDTMEWYQYNGSNGSMIGMNTLSK